MATSRLIVAILGIAMAASTLGADASWAQAVRVEYDTFCQQDRQSKIRLFNEISAENRAELVRTQIERWLNKNKPRLTSEQIKIMEENLSFVRADLYRLPRREEDLVKARELEERTAAVLSLEDRAQALTISSSCIAKG
jgi:hypothetical protein